MESQETSSFATAGAPVAAANTRANTAAWLLVVTFVALVLSVALPAAGGGDVWAALLFMIGLTAALAGSGLALVVTKRKILSIFGAAALAAGLILLYGIIPSLAALGCVLAGVAMQIASLDES